MLKRLTSHAPTGGAGRGSQWVARHPYHTTQVRRYWHRILPSTFSPFAVWTRRAACDAATPQIDEKYPSRLSIVLHLYPGQGKGWLTLALLATAPSRSATRALPEAMNPRVLT